MAVMAETDNTGGDVLPMPEGLGLKFFFDLCRNPQMRDHASSALAVIRAFKGSLMSTMPAAAPQEDAE